MYLTLEQKLHESATISISFTAVTPVPRTIPVHSSCDIKIFE